MDWVFDKFVSWILKNMCSLFEVLSSSMFKFFHMQRDTFDAFFSFFGSAGNGMDISLYDCFRYLGYGLCILIISFRLLANLVSYISDEFEDPLKIGIRAVLSYFLIMYSGSIVDIEFNFMTKPYNTITSMLTNAKKEAGGDKFSMWTNFSTKLKEGYSDIGGGSEVVIDLITLGCLCAIFFGFVKLLLEVAERYVVLCVAFYLSPLAFATTSSKATSRIFHAYLRMILCQLLLMIFNVVFVDGVIIAIYNYATNSGVMTRYNGKEITVPGFVFCILLLAFITVGQKIDNYMRGLGLDAVQTGSIFDEIRGASLNAMAMGRMAGGAIHAAGGVGRFAINAGKTIAGRRATTMTGTGNTAKEGTMAGFAANAGRTIVGSVAKDWSDRGHFGGRKTIRNQIKNGAYNGITGDANKGIIQAVGAAIGEQTFAKMGIQPGSIVGKNGMINFKTMNGATGTLSFDEKNGNGWKQLKDPASGKDMGVWVNGSSNLGISDAKVGAHQSLSEAVGTIAANKISTSLGSIGQGIDASSMEAISLGNGEFSLIGAGEDGMQKNLGRIVSAETAGKISGATLADNEYGGTAGFIPTADTTAAMDKVDFDCGYIHLGQNANAPADAVTDALGTTLEANNIAKGTAMLGFEQDGANYTATFADPISGSKEISGSCADLIGNVNEGDVLSDDNEKVNQVSWMGMSKVFDTNAYSAMTGSTPKEIEYDSTKNNWTVTNEDGSQNIIERVADSGSYTRVIEGGEAVEKIPLSVRSARKDSERRYNDENDGRKKKSSNSYKGKKK